MKNKNDLGSGLLFTISGLAILASYLINLYSDYKSKDWIIINAKVTSIELFSKGIYNSKTGKKSSDKYDVEITYFVNDNFYTTNILTSEINMSEIIIKYNPYNINEIVTISETNNNGSWILNIIGFIFLIYGLFVLIKELIKIVFLRV